MIFLLDHEQVQDRQKRIGKQGPGSAAGPGSWSVSVGPGSWSVAVGSGSVRPGPGSEPVGSAGPVAPGPASGSVGPGPGGSVRPILLVLGFFTIWFKFKHISVRF